MSILETETELRLIAEKNLADLITFLEGGQPETYNLHIKATAERLRVDPVREKATKAVLYVLRRIVDEPEIAWHMGFGTQAFDLLTAAHAANQGKDHQEVKAEWEDEIKPRELRADSRLDVILKIARETLPEDEEIALLKSLKEQIDHRLDRLD